MATDVSFGLMKGSVTGMISPLRRDLKVFMISTGFIKDRIGSCSYGHIEDFDAARTRDLINKLYEIERRHHPARINALKIRGSLVEVEFKRSRYRSI